MAAVPSGPRVLLLGAGLAGGLLALALAERGARVTLSGEPGAIQGATAISYGGVPWWAGADDPLGRLQTSAPTAWGALQSRHGDLGWRQAELWLHGFRPDGDGLALPHAPAGTWLTASQVRQREPLLALEEPTGVLVLPYARIDPLALLRGLERRLPALGVTRCGPLRGAMALGQAHRHHDHTVLCAGAHGTRLLEPLGLPLPPGLDHSWAGVLHHRHSSLAAERIVMPLQPLRPGRECQEAGPASVLDVGLAPAPGGGLLLGQSSWFGRPLVPPSTLADRALLLDAARGLLGSRAAEADGWRLEQRPVAFCRDGRPLVGPHGGGAGVSLFCGFAGPFALVPVLAPMLAEALLSGSLDPLAALGVLPSRLTAT
jgi:glycine/D-amino acid oxidase-like deaminating enzyme